MNSNHPASDTPEPCLTTTHYVVVIVPNSIDDNYVYDDLRDARRAARLFGGKVYKMVEVVDDDMSYGRLPLA